MAFVRLSSSTCMSRLRVMRHWCMMFPMTQQDNPLIGTAEVARLLGKSPRTVHRMVTNGDLTPAMTAPGGKAGVYLFRRSDVQKLVKASAA